MAAFRLTRLLLLLAYPFLVYWGLSTDSRWMLGAVALVLLLPNLYRWSRRLGASGRRVVLLLVLVIGALLLVADIWDNRFFFLCLPVLINLSLLLFFGSTLRAEQSMVESFARAQVDDLSPAEVLYCRRVTKVWCAFFLLNAAATLALAVWASTGVWALYTGLVAYLLMGSLFSVEYLVRKTRFRRFNDSLLDRTLVRLLPSIDSRS